MTVSYTFRVPFLREMMLHGTVCMSERTDMPSKEEYKPDACDDRTSENGIDREHEPTPCDGNLEGDLKKSVLIEFIMRIRGKVLCIGRPTEHCQ